MRPNTFGVPFPFLSLSRIPLLRHSPEMWRFTYCGIGRKDCEYTLCSSPLGEARVDKSRLISVVFFALLEWPIWWHLPSWRFPSPVEGLVVSGMDHVTRVDTGSYVILLCAAWGSDPIGRSWGPGSSNSSCQASLGWVMLEDLLGCQYFAWVKFYCKSGSEWSYTRFSQFPGTLPFLMWFTV